MVQSGCIKQFRVYSNGGNYVYQFVLNQYIDAKLTKFQKSHAITEKKY